MTDNEIIERYFQARGWVECQEDYGVSEFWLAPDCNNFDELPNILESFPAFKQYVLEPMGEEGIKMLVTFNSVRWQKAKGGAVIDYEIYKDNNILHAAVIAATKYWEQK